VLQFLFLRNRKTEDLVRESRSADEGYKRLLVPFTKVGRIQPDLSAVEPEGTLTRLETPN